MVIDDLAKDLKENVHQACVRNTNRRAKPKSSNLKSDLFYQCPFADVL